MYDARREQILTDAASVVGCGGKGKGTEEGRVCMFGGGT